MPDNPCEALEMASRDWIGDAPNGAMLKATRAFLARVREDEPVLAQAAATMSRAAPGAAAWIAVTCGTAVESGASAELAGPAVLALLRTWLPQFPPMVDDRFPPLTPAQRTSLALFRYLCQSVVTHLARLPVARESMGRDVPLLERLGELQALSHGAVWVREALLKSSGTLVFLHPPSATGLKIRYTHVSNCFHLFSLLQSVIGTRIPGGREVDVTLARAARGQSSEAAHDEAWWHYTTALSGRAGAADTVWGEGLVRDIPRIEGLPVIVAWPPLLESRSWDAGFLGPHLDAMPAEAEIEASMAAEEVQGWLARLEIGTETKPWWRFW